MKNKRQNNLTRLATERSLTRAWDSVALKNCGPGFDGVTINKFSHNQRDRLGRLQNELLSETYSPRPYIVFTKQKKNGNLRELVIASLRDKVVSRAVADYLVFNYDRLLQPQSYAYRPRKGAFQAVMIAEKTCKKEVTHALRVDIQDFFNDIDFSILSEILTAIGEDSTICSLIHKCIAADRFDGVELIAPSRGVPQGLPLAPVLSNIYLNRLDQVLNKEKYCFLRFADDLIVFGRNADEVAGALAVITRELRNLKLTPSIDKTRVYTIDDGFIFLGFLFNRNGKSPCTEARNRLMTKLHAGIYNDENPEEYEVRRRSIIRGWNNYFQDETAEVKKFDSALRPTFKDIWPDIPGSNSGAVSTDKAPQKTPVTPLPATSMSEYSEKADSIQMDDGDVIKTFNMSDSLVKTGHWHEAVCKLRQLLNDDELLISQSTRKACLIRLGDIYNGQGLRGAADKCRKIAGVNVGKQTSKKSNEDLNYGERDVKTWLELFGASNGVIYRQYVDQVGRCGFRPASRKLNAEYLRDHWMGRHTIAVPVFNPDNSVPFAVLDLDITRHRLDHCNSDELELLKISLLDYTRGLVDIAHKASIEGLIEDSGYKGYHLWFFFHSVIRASLVKKFLLALVNVAGIPPSGTHVELFPATDRAPVDHLNARIKLPLGIHRYTNNRSLFIRSDGARCRNGIQILQSSIRNKAGRLRAALLEWNRFERTENASESKAESSDIASNYGRTGILTKNCDIYRIPLI